MWHAVTWNFTVPVARFDEREATLPEPLADRIESIAREWYGDTADPLSLQCELMKIAEEVREQMGELAILQRPKRTAMASWRRMIKAMRK